MPSSPAEFTSTLLGRHRVGAYSRHFVVDATQHEPMLGVHFKAGGAFPFLGAPASELTEAHVDLTCLWGDSALELRERLCVAETARERFHIVEGVLASILRRDLPGAGEP